MDRNEATGHRTSMIPVERLGASAFEYLYVLTLPQQSHGQMLELRKTDSGPAVFAYTSMRSLVACCGSGQPWVRLAPDVVAQAANDLAFDVVVIDEWRPDELRYPESDPAEQPDLESLPEGDGPPLIYVPSRPVREGDYVVNLELQPYEGELVLLAYMSADDLYAGCGPHQPWVAVEMDELSDVVAESGATDVVFNAVLTEDSRHTAPVHDWSEHVIEAER